MAKFLELTLANQSKLIVNIEHIATVEGHSTGCQVGFVDGDPVDVNESYDEMKALLSARVPGESAKAWEEWMKNQ